MAKLVRGHLRQRAERVTQLASQGEKSGYERGEMTALLCLRLHPRHLALLRLLYRAPLLSVPEAAAISGMSASTMQRYLYDLRALDVVRVSGHRQQARYQVSESGLRFLAAVQQITIGRIAEQGSAPDGGRTGYVQRGVRMLRRNGRHTAGIYLLLRLLHETAQHERHHRVLWWETGAHSERSYRAQSTWRNLRPDAVFAYQVGARQLVAWVEWDEGSMTARDLAAKLYAYQRFLHAREWGSYDTSVIPILLFIVPEKAQERRVITIARAILAAAGIIVRSTTATRLRREGPLGAIWYPITPREPQATACYPLFTAEKPYPRDL